MTKLLTNLACFYYVDAMTLMIQLNNFAFKKCLRGCTFTVSARSKYMMLRVFWREH